MSRLHRRIQDAEQRLTPENADDGPVRIFLDDEGDGPADDPDGRQRILYPAIPDHVKAQHRQRP